MIDDGRIFDPGFKLEPYWWEARERRPDAGTGGPAPLPTRADVVIVGGGLTGVEAGRVLAAAGRDVLVLDAGEPGEGASSRNAGMLGRSFKHGFGDLTHTLGLDRAKAYFTELRAAYDGAAAVAAADPEATAWRKCGRIVAGMTPAHAERIRREYALRAEHLGEEYEEIRPDEVADEVGTPLYHGGVRVLENGAIQPALYYAHMRRRSEAAGEWRMAERGGSVLEGWMGRFA